MITKAIKQGLTFAVVMAFLVGCSSADKKKAAPAPAPAPTPVVQEAPAPVVQQVANVVYFDYDKYDLTPEARAILLAHAEKLKSSSSAVRLEGHADERGSREYNIALGEKRAKAARDFKNLRLNKHLRVTNINLRNIAARVVDVGRNFTDHNGISTIIRKNRSAIGQKRFDLRHHIFSGRVFEVNGRGTLVLAEWSGQLSTHRLL